MAVQSAHQYHPVMKRQLAWLLALLGSGAIASQAGHLLVYELQYGSAAQAVQSQGVHAYFPVLAKSTLGFGALAILALLLMVAASRMLAVRPGSRITHRLSYFNLLALLFTIQISCFMVQETIEAAAAGTVASATHLLMLASLGQLPIAVVAALVFKWLAARVEVAFTAIRQALRTKLTFGATITLGTPASALPRLVLTDTCPSVFVKRGPPPVLLSL
jgi:hypothetical protein